MVKTIDLPNIANRPRNLVYRDELLRLKDPRQLARRLVEIDQIARFGRLYVMGCGRSGTWLLFAVLSTFTDIEIVPMELSIEHFGVFYTNHAFLGLKRDSTAYQLVENIPESISILYIIRHPFDVLTSHNPVVAERLYYMTPHRWLGEMLALQYIIDTRRPNTKIIRYEDLAHDPAQVQSEIGALYSLDVQHSIDHVDFTFKGPPEAIAAMHGLRKIDTKSVGKYRNDPEKIAYLRRLRPRLGRLLDWTAETFGYDVDL
jgi:hypothetical protein